MTRRLPPLRALRAFEAAARHLSFAAAADELRVTPAAVSQQVKLLEDWLGVPLFRRQPRLRLTEPAAAALAPLSDAFDRLEDAARRLTVAGGGPLVVSAPPSFAARWLVPRLERFDARHPEIDLRISASRRLVDFAAEGVDMAIRYGAGRYPGLHVEKLRDEEALVMAAPRVAANITGPAGLLDCTLLVNEAMAWDATFPDWPSWLAAQGVEVGNSLKLRRFEDFTLVLEAALAGLGVALLWRSLVDEEMASGRLVPLFGAHQLAHAYHLVCPPAHLDNPKVAAFRSWVIEEAKKR